MYAEGQADTLQIRFNDTQSEWDTWKPQIGDEIIIDYGSISTGRMFVASLSPENGFYSIIASSSPLTLKEAKSKSWQKVSLTQIGDEIAINNGLSFKSYSVNDVLFEYLLQTNQSDFDFLQRLCIFEGLAFQIFNGELILYSQSKMEGFAPTKEISLTPDSDFRFTNDTSMQYGTCYIEKGIFKGTYKAENGCSRLLIPRVDITLTSNSQAERYAKNLLREENKNTAGGYIYGRIMPEYAAASTASISAAKASSFNGPVFITHIRNDYSKGKSKMFFRKPLGEY